MCETGPEPNSSRVPSPNAEPMSVKREQHIRGVDTSASITLPDHQHMSLSPRPLPSFWPHAAVQGRIDRATLPATKNGGRTCWVGRDPLEQVEAARLVRKPDACRESSDEATSGCAEVRSTLSGSSPTWSRPSRQKLSPASRSTATVLASPAASTGWAVAGRALPHQRCCAGMRQLLGRCAREADARHPCSASLLGSLLLGALLAGGLALDLAAGNDARIRRRADSVGGEYQVSCHHGERRRCYVRAQLDARVAELSGEPVNVPSVQHLGFARIDRAEHLDVLRARLPR